MRIADRSLRAGLLLRIVSGALVLLTLDAGACYYTALHFANLVYDRWLVDSTRSLSKALQVQDGRIAFDLPRAGVAVFQFDVDDKTYFKVSTDRQGFIGGVGDLPMLPGAATGLTISDSSIEQQPVRLVSLGARVPGSDERVTIEVAETLNKRSQLTEEILLAMVLPQIALLIVAVTLAWWSVARSLKPLTDLATELQSRDHENLTAVAESGLPWEARILVGRINELLKRVDRAIRMQRDFVADVAHQLRTPLAAMLLQIVQAERAHDPQNLRSALGSLHSSVQRAARLSQQLLTLAQTEPEAVGQTRFQPLDLVALTRRVGEEWIATAIEREIDFGLVAPEHAVVVNGQENLLTEMLSNLLDNALRYTPPGGMVTLLVQDETQKLIAVEDSGPGIPAAERTRIFERFYRPLGSPGEGSGLGLAIVAEIARLHRAAVIVSSEPDRAGTRFAVQFESA